MKKYISVLTIAGSDSGGGAGIQADLKTFSALGCYGTSAITGITAQNTVSVAAVFPISPLFLVKQIRSVLDDIKPLAIKVGMIPNEGLARAIALVFSAPVYKHYRLIYDPVMISSSGSRLMEEDAIAIVQKDFFPLVTLLTPNMDEAGLLAGMVVKTVDDMKAAAAKIVADGCNAVLVKGGHLTGGKLYNVYFDKAGNEHIFSSDAVATNNTHGTGCTLSSAITAFLARGFSLVEAIEQAGVYMHAAIEAGKDVKTGEGHGPVNHFFDPVKLITYES